MKLLRLCIALFGLLAFLGSSQACLILGEHLAEVACAEKCPGEEDQACAGCATPVDVVSGNDALQAPSVQALATSWQDGWLESRVTLALAQPAEIYPPPDPTLISWSRRASTRCLPARGPNLCS
ncbi:MAG: hypothetical protein JSR82_06020 [Verrucomicrobia bacterium]|nr:hypothetical protein [Verrucomicrobiota bacterium]